MVSGFTAALKDCITDTAVGAMGLSVRRTLLLVLANSKIQRANILKRSPLSKINGLTLLVTNLN
jgi:hypothetical protein